MDKLSVEEAAKVLGIKEESVRKRVSRGTLDAEKDREGRIRVWVDTSVTGTGTVRDEYGDGSETERDELVESKDETISVLREQLESERQAHAEARRIIAGLVERIPAIEAPQDAHEGTEGEESRPDVPGAQEGVQRPWWRRVFGS